MSRIELDFQPRRPGPATLAVLLAAALLCADAWLDERALRADLAAVETRIAASRARSEKPARTAELRAQGTFTAQQDKALRQAIAAIGVDWEALYRGIDRAVGEDVALLAVRPNASNRSVEIAGEARDIRATLAFVEALRAAPLASVVLVSHQIKQNDPQAPIVFEISAKWSTAS